MLSHDDLIYDLGTNQGEDTAFYLAKGFRVVGVEANPMLYAALAEKLAEPIAAGRLTLLNIGIWDAARTLTFYANQENDHWSSFDPAYGTRQGTRYETLEIPCLTVLDLLRQYGVPRYLKIDIEGADRLVLAQLRQLARLPRYISVEEYGVEALHDLAALGYSRFKLLPQADKSWAEAPQPPREGSYAKRWSDGRDSGLFGAELPGEWLSYAAAETAYLTGIRNAAWEYVGPPGEWWDIHATR